MIVNITNNTTHVSLQDALDGLPVSLDKDYTIEVSGETNAIAGFEYKSKSTNGFKLTIQSTDLTEINDGTDGPIEINGSGILDVDIIGFVVKGFVNGGIYLTGSACARVFNCQIEGEYKCIRAYQHGTLTVQD